LEHELGLGWGYLIR
jgi:hypothetical protein